MNTSRVTRLFRARNGVLASHSQKAALAVLAMAAVLSSLTLIRPQAPQAQAISTSNTASLVAVFADGRDADRLSRSTRGGQQPLLTPPTVTRTDVDNVIADIFANLAEQRRLAAEKAAAEAARLAAEEAARQAAEEAAAAATRANAGPAEFRAYAASQMSADQFSCLQYLWGRESGWNNHAQNPGSTAYGIAQFLDSTWASTGIAKTSDGFLQVDAGLRYLSSRYGSPCGGAAHSRATGWY